MYWKTFWKFFLAAAVLLGLTACSGKEDAEKSTNTEYVYQMEKAQEVKIQETCFQSFSHVLQKNGKVYLFYSERPEENHVMISCDVDGNNIAKTELKELEGIGIYGIFIDDQKDFRLLAEKDDQIFLYTMEETGEVSSSISLNLKQAEYVNSMAFLDKKSYFLKEKEILVFDKKGAPAGTYGRREAVYDLFLNDGNLYIYGEGEGSDDGKTGFQEFDPETGKFGEFFDFGEYKPGGFVVGTEKSKVYLANDTAVYSYDFSDGALKKEFEWLRIGLNYQNIKSFLFMGDGNFLAVTGEEDGAGETNVKFAMIRKVDAKEAENTKIVTLDTLGLSTELEKEILAFNEEQDDITVAVNDYSGYEDPWTKMQMDLTMGVVPDIIDLGYEISIEMLAEKGLLADLYPLMEKDSKVKKEDFIPSVLNAMEIDKKLYTMGDWFYINALAAGKKTVGESEGFTTEEMLALYGTKKEMTFCNYVSKEALLSDIFYNGSYLDYSEKKAYFDTRQFTDWMEFLKELPENAGQDAEEKETFFLCPISAMNHMTDIRNYEKLFKGQGGLAIMSYPSEDKNNQLSMSFAINGSPLLAITQQCIQKDAAWTFVRRFLTYDYQKNGGNVICPFPTRQDVFEEKLAEAMTESFTDDDGKKVKPLSKKEAEILRSMVSRVGIYARQDQEREKIFDIVMEEMEAYFAGDKTAEETAELIQGRAELYLSERFG